MADFDLTFNSAQLLDGAEAAFKDFNQVLGRQFQQRITDNIWPWPTETERENGETASTKRDIVDLGQLRDSYDLDEVNPATFDHRWPTDYAMAVHEGAARSGGKSTPARPWVRKTLADFDAQDAYAKLAEIEMRKRAPP